MVNRMFTALAVAGAIIAASAGWPGRAAAQEGPGDGGPGWMGPGMMWGGYGPGWMGPGMMGGWGGYGGYGPGMMGGWGPQQPADLNLSVGQVKQRMAQWIAASGNPHVKLGPVKQKNADVITAEIVTADGNSLVETYDIDRHTGFLQPERN